MKIRAAHINSEGREQSVRDHCVNTAHYSEENGALIGLQNTMKLAGILHDCGKNTNAFDTYIRKAVRNPNSVKKGEINHSSAGARVVYEILNRIESPDKISKLTAQMIACSIMSHHGLMDCVSPEGKNIFEARIYPDRNIYFEEAIKNSGDFLDTEMLSEIFNLSCREIQLFAEKLQSFPDINKHSGNYMFGCMQRMMLSMLIDADRRDTSEFMTGIMTKRMTEEEVSTCWNEYLERLETRIQGFDSSSRIDGLRAEMSELCADFSEKPDGIYRLSIPTGGGKTYSSMRYALRLAIRTKKRHIYYIAPFLSILEQNAEDIRKVFDDEAHILEHHSNMAFEEEESEILSEYQMLADEWSAPVIMTTMVRFLEVLFGGGIRDIRRFHQLKDSVIIIDEAQSLPIRCIHMFNTMMNFLYFCCSSTVIVCTATQPLFERCDQKLIYGNPADMIRNGKQFEKEFRRVQISQSIVKGRKIGTDEFIQFIGQVFEKNMLVILNTKDAVRKLCEGLRKAMSSNISVIQLTTYMCAKHRIDVINDLKKRLKTDQIICVSTQLIEAGVDVSFCTVIRSLAGLDSIAQAAGRCNRNGELKDYGRMFLVDYEEEKLGSMTDIILGRYATQSILDKYDGDLLSSEAMNLYYQNYFWARKGDMNYSVKKDKLNLYDLLSLNQKGKCAMEVRGDEYPYIMAQAFKSAGKLFRPIEEMELVGLVVPYGEASQWTDRLNGEKNIEKMKWILKKLQRYTVNINMRSIIWKELLERNAVNRLLRDEVFLLDRSFYTIDGVSTELSLLVL